MRTRWLILLLCFCISSVASRGSSYRTNTIEGWRVLIDERLLNENGAATEKALSLLAAQLREIVEKIPAPAVTQLRRITLWFSPPYSSATPKAEYHPAVEWLRGHGRNPAMAKAVEFTNIDQFEAETRRMPNFTLHELAHAFHHQFLTNGFQNEEIKATFDRAKAGGAYEKVERRHGAARTPTQERAYAMSDAMEYFAETSEAFFSANDFFPFTRQELKSHDPEMHALLARLWGANN
jgi:hypothetical protein